MTNIVLKLKLRNRGDSVRVSTQQIVEWLNKSENEAKDLMYQFFSPYLKADAKIHDKVFLETTCNWSPATFLPDGRLAPTGLSMTEYVKWIELTKKISAIDETKEEELELDSDEADMIIDRWKNPEFKLITMPSFVAEFVMEFQRETKRWFPDLKPKEADEEKQDGD